MYEHKSAPLASQRKFIQRVIRNVILSLSVIAACLILGVLGYHFTANIPWLDSLHNASMILSGMGPVVVIETDSGKYFSSFYALFSGIVFISNVGILLAPVAHRLLHRLSLED